MLILYNVFVKYRVNSFDCRTFSTNSLPDNANGSEWPLENALHFNVILWFVRIINNEYYAVKSKSIDRRYTYTVLKLYFIIYNYTYYVFLKAMFLFYKPTIMMLIVLIIFLSNVHRVIIIHWQNFSIKLYYYVTKVLTPTETQKTKMIKRFSCDILLFFFFISFDKLFFAFDKIYHILRIGRCLL